MHDTFKWTRETINEFLDSFPDADLVQLADRMEQFKSSKSPKKEWEIVAYQVRDKNVYYPEYTDDIGRIWGNAEWKGAFIDSADVNHPDVKIFSVRRLSDQIIFTKNEVVGTPSDGQHHIGGFEIRGNCMYAQFSVGQISIEHLQKLPQKVFTTIDGADIYEDGNFWHVNEDWTLSNFGVSTEFIDYSKPDKDFSTRQAAEEYILNNRPLLSLSDVKYVLDSIQFAHDNTRPFILEVLTNAVKQKLNQ